MLPDEGLGQTLAPPKGGGRSRPLGPKLVEPNPVPVTIDDHAPFWSTYDKVSGDYDREMIAAWNASLDVLLIFAGLFSAINTAFIIESYKGLQADPAEITNDLLRILISHKSNDTTPSSDELHPGSPAPSAKPITSIFFSSLSFSLTAAFGAVTAKQWLTEYISVGAVKALHRQGRERQEKHRGLKRWHLRLIIELLPMFLQLSVLLFMIGVVDFLWQWDRTVGIVQLVLSCAGLAVYLITIVIGIMIQSSPFQTPLSRYVPRYCGRMYRSLKFAAPDLGINPKMKYAGQLLGQVLRWIKSLSKAAGRNLARRIRLLSARANGFHEAPSSPSISLSIFPEDPTDERSEWDPALVTAAESVVWLLERAEHPDVTITALDAVRRLPPSLIFRLIEERKGLMYRLIAFHHSLFPMSSSTTDQAKLLTEWPNAAVASALAWHHILWAIPLGSGSDEQTIRSHLSGPRGRFDLLRLPDDCSEILLAAKFMLGFNLDEAMSVDAWGIFGRSLKLITSSMPESDCTLRIEFTDLTRASIKDHFVTPFSPLQLVLDSAILCSARDISIFIPDHYLFELLTSLLGNELSHDIVSHVAITIAAIHSKLYIVDNSYASSGSTGTKHLLRDPPSDIMEAVYNQINCLMNAMLTTSDTRSMLLEHVALAFSTVAHARDHTIGVFKALLKITTPLFEQFHYPGNPIQNQWFPQDLIQFARFTPQDAETQTIVANLLCKCPEGNWGQDIHTFIQSVPKLPRDQVNPRDPIWALLERIERESDDTKLYNTFQSSTSLRDYLVDTIQYYPPYQGPSWNLDRLMKIYDTTCTDNSYLLQTQISYAIMVFVTKYPHQGNAGRVVSEFLDMLLARETELHWPAYPKPVGPAGSGGKGLAQGILESIQPQAFGSPPPELLVFKGEASILLWSKAKKTRSRVNTPTEWESSLFFSTQVATLMLEYWTAAKELRTHAPSKYNSMDFSELKEYLKSALKGWNANHNGGRERENTRRKFEEILQELNKP
ncbi:hypothetical protein FRC03_003004 [Tulasnella sp. 419]|nr:hypothetical protein FRC03_003004 [Tulasnella sp. 419]